MELIFKDNNIILRNKILSELDTFTFKFIEILKKYADYVIVSGYVAILFGRSRGTEDIDILIEKIDKDAFDKLFDELTVDYWFINPESREGLFEMLNDKLAIRVAKKGEIIPNIEIKFAKHSFEKYALKNALNLNVNDTYLKISPIELQIAYKVYLGSEKDWMDARHLFGIFRNNIDYNELNLWFNNFNINEKTIEKCLGRKIKRTK